MEYKVGTSVMVTGGYEHEPGWLGGRAGVHGRIVGWIPGQNDQPACVVLLNEPLTAEGIVGTQRKVMTGTHLVLELRYVGQVWEESGTVHVELCPSEPEPLKWGPRAVGARVESHATYTFTW